MARDIPPAIARRFDSDDRLTDDDLIGTPYNDVSFHRGLGDSGRKVEVVDRYCPACDHDRMVRKVDVSPVDRDYVKYWCLYPNCQHFVGNTLSYLMQNNYPQRPAREPMVSDA